jgi:hypothetical protein
VQLSRKRLSDCLYWSIAAELSVNYYIICHYVVSLGLIICNYVIKLGREGWKVCIIIYSLVWKGPGTKRIVFLINKALFHCLIEQCNDWLTMQLEVDRPYEWEDWNNDLIMMRIKGYEVLWLISEVRSSVDILAVRHVKQGIEAERFRAVQPLVQVTYITLHWIRSLVRSTGGRFLRPVAHIKTSLQLTSRIECRVLCCQ